MFRSSTIPLFFVLLLLFGAAGPVRAQGLVINEVMASNQRTIADEDTEYPDWIELYNAGDEAIDLGGYALSDDPNQPTRWPMPPGILPPGEHMLIFASGKDRRGGNGFWETVVDYGHEFKYYIGSAQPFLWTFGSYDDSAWSEGPSPLGYELDAAGADIATTVPSGTVTMYLRTTFTVPGNNDVLNAVLHVDYDDAFVAYLNGGNDPVARGNMPELLSHGDPATADHEAAIYAGGDPERFEIPDADALIHPGENVLALKLHNVASTSSDFTIIPFLTLSFAQPLPDGAGTSTYIPHDLDTRPHANFKLDATAEYLILSDTLGTVVDSIAFTGMGADESVGRKPDGAAEWLTFLEPTPGAPNLTEGYAGAPLIAPVFSIPAGKYASPVSVSLSSPEGAAIHFTTDGSTPTSTSPVYTTPFGLTQTTVIRARALSPGRLPSLVTTNTYLVNENSDIAVVSLATDPPNLWDYETGIYVDGPGWTAPDPHFGANYWMDWEIPMHVEMFEPAGDRVISQNAGGRIYGAWSRARPQKSLALFARNEYGNDRFQYRIWPDRNYDSFHSIVLRNSGNDANQLHFIDAFMQELVHYTGMETLEYRPSHVFLNGEYWGILNLREKANEHLAAGRHGLDPDSIDVLEMSNGTAVAAEGSAAPYFALVSYLEQNDVAQANVYDEVSRRVDIDNFIDYQITQIYIANLDWPGNNQKFWRPQRPDGKYRWILFDTDFGFGYAYGNNPYTHNTLAFATATNGPGWPNPPFSTYLLRTLLRNQTFRHRFINRFADHLNYTFDPERVQFIMDEMSPVVEPEINRHFLRWGGSMDEWRTKRSSMMSWGRARTPFMWGLLRSFFSLPPPMEVTVNTASLEHGRVRVNRHMPDAYPWAGEYFPGFPVQIEAVPRPGYRFARWSGGSQSTNRTLSIDPLYGFSATAHFELDDALPAPITIAEVQYHAANDMQSGDWVELYNPMSFDVDVSNWLFQDADTTHSLFLPSGTTVPANGYVVLAQDPAAFSAVYPSAPAPVGGFDFGLANSGETLRLFSASGELVDEVRYLDDAPWPAAPDGSGPTLELAHLSEDNAIPSFWQSSALRGGSPGARNSVDVPVAAEDEPDLPRELELQPAYPNPFHHATHIPFALPEAAFVTLRVYNALGQAVETVLDEARPAGMHEAVWSPSGAASGVYFYELLVDGARRATGTAVLIR